MRIIGSVLVFLVTASAYASSLWIIGEDYVGKTDLRSKPIYHTGLKPGSSGLDPDGCRVWIADESSRGLVSISGAEKPAPVATEVGKVLSSVTDGIFLTRSSDGLRLEKRDLQGKLLRGLDRHWVTRSEAVATHGDRAWSLELDPKSHRLTVAHLDAGFDKTGESLVADGINPWGARKLELDPARGLWVGFSAHGNKSYNPFVQQWTLEGERKVRVSWKERGHLFDSCLEKDGSLLVARDVPSDSGFTVPFHSYLERVSPEGKVESVFQSDVNWFIDAIACRPEAVYLVQRSIFGSDGSYLVRWDREPGKLGTELFRLPNKAKKLYFCQL